MEFLHTYQYISYKGFKHAIIIYYVLKVNNE